MLRNFANFLHYWYFRYLMVTELYMVEKWERAAANMFFILFIGGLSYFNYTVALSFASRLLKVVMFPMRNIMPSDIQHEHIFTSSLTSENIEL